jgi:hypothetical protein
LWRQFIGSGGHKRPPELEEGAAKLTLLAGTDTHMHGAAPRDPAAEVNAGATSVDGAVANLEAEA